MDNKELLQKLNFLVKELNETHTRLQRSNEKFQEIEVALLGQQVVNMYQHLKRLEDTYKKAGLQETSQPAKTAGAAQTEIKSPLTDKNSYPKPAPEPEVAPPSQNFAPPKESAQPASQQEKPNMAAVAQEQNVSNPPAAIIEEKQTETPQQTEIETKTNEPLKPEPTPEAVSARSSQDISVMYEKAQASAIQPASQNFTAPTPKNEPETPVNQPVAQEEKQETASPVTPPEPLIESLPQHQDSAATETKTASAEPRSINERFAQQQVKQNLADKLKLSPIKDLKTAMGLNQRISFMKNLFGGNDDDFKKSVSKLNDLKSYAEAKFYLQTDIMPKYNWDEESPLVQEFMGLVYRKFL